MNKFKIADGTVYYHDGYGERWDLNAHGKSIHSDKELVEFVSELHTQKFFDKETANQLIEQI